MRSGGGFRRELPGEPCFTRRRAIGWSAERGRGALRRVLCIDGSRMDRLLVRTLLALRGGGRILLSEADDLDRGLALLYQRRFDLILLGEACPELGLADAERAIRGVAPVTPVLQLPRYLSTPGPDLDGLLAAVRARLLPERRWTVEV